MQSMFCKFVAALGACCIGLLMALSAPSAKDGVNGRNVTKVAATDGTTFTLLPTKRWIQRTRDGKLSYFNESSRNEWSVLLFDPSREF